ncbi:MAG: hypothetical protein K2X32_09530 [Phycisphaerales bacterium]|nr:hypothetical protein [Phycisphaerales bacterium]
MSHDAINERFFSTLIAGDRNGARKGVLDAYAAGFTPRDLYTELYWPTFQMLDKLHRADQLSKMSFHMASRLLRVLVDQTAAKLEPQATLSRRVLCFCGATEGEELGAQMAVDLLEAAGFSVTFGGGGVAADEIMALAQEQQPDVLLMFASAASDLPGIRVMIEQIRDNGACEGLQFAVGAGVFTRAEGLAEEMGADIWADSPIDMVDALVSEPTKRSSPSQRNMSKLRRSRAA